MTRVRSSDAHTLRTSDISKATGVHPNTVRLYEKWGYLPPIPRSSSGYRLFTHAHVEQMRLARLAFEDPWPGGQIRRSASALVRRAVSGDIEDAQQLANKHLLLIRSELAQARAAVDYLEVWASDSLKSDFPKEPLLTGKIANLIDVTIDTLRHWERNGLIVVPRNPVNGYRLYGSSEIGRLRVIRVLTRSGFSTMAVLRMVRQLDRGFREQLTKVLDTPGEDEDILYATDRWLSTLQEHEDRVLQIINQLRDMKDLHQP